MCSIYTMSFFKNSVIRARSNRMSALSKLMWRRRFKQNVFWRLLRCSRFLRPNESSSSSTIILLNGVNGNSSFSSKSSSFSLYFLNSKLKDVDFLYFIRRDYFILVVWHSRIDLSFISEFMNFSLVLIRSFGTLFVYNNFYSIQIFD